MDQEVRESPVCVYCGHHTWFAGECWNPMCDSPRRPRRPIVDVELPPDDTPGIPK